MEGSKDTGLKIQAFLVGPLNRLLTNYLSTQKGMGAYTSQTLSEILSGCSERPQRAAKDNLSELARSLLLLSRQQYRQHLDV